MIQEKSVDTTATQADCEANMSMRELSSRIVELADEMHGIREQLRIANLIKLGLVEYADVSSYFSHWKKFWVDEQRVSTPVSEITEALGISKVTTHDYRHTPEGKES